MDAAGFSVSCDSPSEVELGSESLGEGFLLVVFARADNETVRFAPFLAALLGKEKIGLLLEHARRSTWWGEHRGDEEVVQARMCGLASVFFSPSIES